VSTQQASNQLGWLAAAVPLGKSTFCGLEPHSDGHGGVAPAAKRAKGRDCVLETGQLSSCLKQLVVYQEKIERTCCKTQELPELYGERRCYAFTRLFGIFAARS